MSQGAPPAEILFDVPAGKLAEVVTSLQMREPRPARPQPGRSDLSLRLVDHPGIEWYRDLFRRVGAPWLWSSRLELSDAALAAEIDNPDVEIGALVHDGADEGLFELDFRKPGTCELVFFGMTGALTGRGAGHWLMEHAVRHAWARPVERLWLHTCTLDHPAALAFYMKNGFVPFRQQVRVADDPRHLGVVPLDAAPRIPYRVAAPG